MHKYDLTALSDDGIRSLIGTPVKFTLGSKTDTEDAGHCFGLFLAYFPPQEDENGAVVLQGVETMTFDPETDTAYVELAHGIYV